jgi:transposase
MKESYLSAEERAVLRGLHKQTRESRVADRFKAVLMRDKGMECAEIAGPLMLDDSTLRNYLSVYQDQGIQGLSNWGYKGGNNRKLSQAQEKELTQALQKHTYQTAQEIVIHIQECYGIEYSVDGVTKLIKRLGFVHKLFSGIPAKADGAEQAAFVEDYQTLKSELKEDEVILFADATHPDLQVKLSRGWIKKGQQKTISTRSDRSRLNIIGSINVTEPTQVVMQDYKRINSDNIITWLKQIEKTYQNKTTIYLIVDGARYFNCEQTKAYLKTSTIQFKFLPPYSPNLNPIERFWKFFNQKFRANRDFKTLAAFRSAAHTFFKNLHPYRDVLKSWITDNFQTLKSINATF